MVASPPQPTGECRGCARIECHCSGREAENGASAGWNRPWQIEPRSEPVSAEKQRKARYVRTQMNISIGALGQG